MVSRSERQNEGTWKTSSTQAYRFRNISEGLLVSLNSKLHNGDAILLVKRKILLVTILGTEVNKRVEFKRFEKGVVELVGVT